MLTEKKYAIKIDGHYIADFGNDGFKATDKIQHAILFSAEKREMALKMLAVITKPEYLDKIESELVEITLEPSDTADNYVISFIGPKTGEKEYFVAESKTSIMSNSKFFCAKQMCKKVADAYYTILNYELESGNFVAQDLKIEQVEIKYNVIKTL